MGHPFVLTEVYNNPMDKHKENGILLVPRNVLKCVEEVDDLKKEVKNL